MPFRIIVDHHHKFIHIHIKSLFWIFRNNNCLKTFFKKWIVANYRFSKWWSEFVSLFLSDEALKKSFFLIVFFFNIFYYRVWLLLHISLELTRANPDRNMFAIKYGTNIYFIYSIEVWSIIVTKFLDFGLFNISELTCALIFVFRFNNSKLACFLIFVVRFNNSKLTCILIFVVRFNNSKLTCILIFVVRFNNIKKLTRILIFVVRFNNSKLTCI